MQLSAEDQREHFFEHVAQDFEIIRLHYNVLSANF